MRGCYTLALPGLSASRIGSAVEQGRSAAGYYSRFAAKHDAAMMRQG